MTPRKPRKMPKNQRPYPKKGKPRLVKLTDPAEVSALQLAELTGDISAPKLYVLMQGANKVISFLANPSEMRKWRALRNPPETEAVKMTHSFSEALAQRSIEARERPAFEGYVQRVFPHCWPNPDLDGNRTFTQGAFVGQYHNNKLNYMWQSWLARALLQNLTSVDGGEDG